MDCMKRKRLPVLILCLATAGLTGCNSMDNALTRMAGKQTTDVVPGIVPPGERIAILRKIRDRASRAKPEEQQRVSGELAAAFGDESDPMLRTEIVRALEGYPTEASASVLGAALEDSDTDVRVAACRAWGNRGGTEAVTRLSGVLSSDMDNDVRIAAIDALGKTGDPAAMPALGQALSDPNPAMQYRAVDSLRKVTNQNLGNDVNRWQEYVATATGASAGDTVAR